MKTYTVHFHQEDRVDAMQVEKLSEADFDKLAAGGIRQLFELDTNFGSFVFLDAEDDQANESYIVMRYEDDEADDASDIYSFKLKDFYDMLALFMSQMYFDEEDDEDIDGPVHQLAHLLHHIVEDGKDVTP